MADSSAKSTANASRARKRVEADAAVLKRARDGSAFTRCEACNKDVPVVLIDMHSCSLDSKIRLSLEAQVVEKAVEIKKTERKRSVPSGPKERSSKKKKDAGGSDKRKRPPTAFFVFMDDFRKEYKAAHPDNKSVASVAKDGGEKWKSMTDEEKKPYIEKAAELKAEYDKAEQADDKSAEGGDENEVAVEGENAEEGEGENAEEGEEEKNELDDDI